MSEYEAPPCIACGAPLIDAEYASSCNDECYENAWLAMRPVGNRSDSGGGSDE